MSNYTKITDFAAKDAMLTGNPLKEITGTAHDNEFNAIAAAIATKQDSLSLGANVATFLATPNSANLAAALTDESGTGVVPFMSSGTWTPSVGGTATYSGRQGVYVKIGQLVFINGFLQISSIGTGSSNRVSGLPFTSANTINYSPIAITACSALATAVSSLCFAVESSANSMVARAFTSINVSDTTTIIFGNSTSLYFSGIYQSAS